MTTIHLFKPEEGAQKSPLTPTDTALAATRQEPEAENTLGTSRETLSSPICIYSTETSTGPLLTEDTIIANLPSAHNRQVDQHGCGETDKHGEEPRYDGPASSDVPNSLFSGSLFSEHDLAHIFSSMGNTMHAHSANLYGNLAESTTFDLDSINELLSISAGSMAECNGFYKGWPLETTSAINTQTLHVTLDSATVGDMLMLEDIFASYSIFSSITTSFS